MLCDYQLSEQYVLDMVRTYKHKTGRDAYGYILKVHSWLWRTIEDSQSNVSRDNLDVMLPKSEGLS